MSRLYRILITTGDIDGVGLEVSAKALYHLGPQKGAQFFLWRSQNANARYLRLIKKKFNVKTVTSWPEALEARAAGYKDLIDINSKLSPATWVEISARAGLLKTADALVTAPLSKTSILSSGLKDIGHTDILKRVSGSKHIYMGFIGNKMNVVIASGHIPVKDISGALSTESLKNAISAALILRKNLSKSKSKKPIALLGLNPHSGEDGLIGEEEQVLHLPLLKKLKEQNIPIIGPLVPDAAFSKKTLEEVSVYVANYHDQGLIPFKALNGTAQSVHVSLGLPFLRTSVDHGTAKDIFGKDRADSSSMQDAIKTAVHMLRNDQNFYSENLK